MDPSVPAHRVNIELDHALRLVRRDRWLIGCPRQGRLRVVADSNPEPERPFRRLRHLSDAARRCLQEMRPQVISTVVDLPPEGAGARDWELAWPALVYAPVGMPRRRPLGLLIVGSASQHWYTPAEVEYVAALAVALTPAVLWLHGPLGRLRPEERQVVSLVGAGLSAPEIARALSVPPSQLEGLVDDVIRKLCLRCPGQLAETWPELDGS
jgi:hypothetical protein